MTLPRTSNLFIRTLRNDPREAEIKSHKLLVRAGYIYRTAAGIYSYGSLFVRVIRKVEAILRQELAKCGAAEIWMPVLAPKDLWLESGRWDGYVAEGLLFHLEDRKGAELALGPTHEEVVTDIARRMIRSYKELPVILYQQQTKFRDEIRPRFGLMRGREFVMKDAYSFDRDEEGLAASYQAMRDCYRRSFDRMGLRYIVVDADPGAIGGSGSEEFMVVAGAGEDAILSCPSCGYAANVEKAESFLSAADLVATTHPGVIDDEELKLLEKHPTPNIRSVEQLETFFGMPASKMVKTLVYKATFRDREEFVAVLLRGDTEANPIKVQNALGALAVRLAEGEEIPEATGAPQGFAGPIGLRNASVIADEAVRTMKNFLCGVNCVDIHATGVNIGRDFPEPRFADLRLARPGERCARCQDGVLDESRGIEVGHVFKLGTKYSEAMKATFTDEAGRERPFVMGCYGIGITRVAQAAVEQHHDEKGIVWPLAIAPFEVIVIAPAAKNKAAVDLALEMAAELSERGVEAVLEDRPLSAGQLFKDAELLGIPFQLVAGRLVKEGKVELTCRRDGTREELPVRDAVSRVAARVSEMKSRGL